MDSSAGPRRPFTSPEARATYSRMAHTSQSRNHGWTPTNGSGAGDRSLAAEEVGNGVGRAADALGLFEVPLQRPDEEAHHAVQSRDAIFRRLLALADVLAMA